MEESVTVPFDTTPAEDSPIDRDELLGRIDGDLSLLAEIVGMFLDDCPARMAEIAAAVEEGEPARIRMAAHSLKGAAGVMAARPVAAAAHELERMGAAGEVGNAHAAFAALTAEVARLVAAMQRMQGDAQ